MTLSTGTRLGTFEIIGLLGAGGMGEVYRARDTKLERDVAIKVLPELFVADPGRVARFQREAKTLASLNHPHIGAIYGLEEVPGVTALVLELVEGPTLADRIAQGPIAVEEALPIARQIADALEAAHEHGVIHRDLKPANIKVSVDGAVKVLDFGLAKPVVSELPSGSPGLLANSPTLSAPLPMTGVGVLLGTAAYMPPEQARGKDVDRRADIWAFGCVLYEMLSGRQAFAGEDVPDTLGAVLRGEVDWRALPRDAPMPVRRLLQRCLQKDRARRLQHIGDARLEIDEALAEPAAAPVPLSTRTVSRARYAGWALAVVLSAAVGAAVMFVMRDEPAVQRRIRFDIAPPAGMQLAAPPGRLAVSPDGSAIAFAVTGEVPGQVRLFLRDLGSEEARPIPGTEGVLAIPFWSPDGRFLAFVADGKLKSVEVSNGLVQQICEMPSKYRANPSVGSPAAVASGTWSSDGTIIFSVAAGAGGVTSAFRSLALFRVPATGGQPTAATTLGEDEAEHAFPQFLPDGEHFLYRVLLRSGESRAYVQTLTSSSRTHVLTDVVNVQYAWPGYLLYVREQTLYAQAFDAARLAVTGEPRVLANEVLMTPGGRGVFSVSDGGLLAYSSVQAQSSEFIVVDRSGLGTALGEPAPYRNSFDLSPDGSRLVVAQSADGGGAPDLWVINLETGVRSRVTFDRANDGDPVWSPNGLRIVFTTNRKGYPALFMKEFGSSEEELLLDGVEGHFAEDWSSDGRYLAFLAGRPSTQIGVLPLADPERKPIVVVSSPFDKDEPHFSPDARWIAFNSSESGTSQVYVTAFPPDGRQWQVSPSGGMQARWRGDGRELYYLAPDGMLMALPMDPATGRPTGRASPLFQTNLQPVPNQDQYEVTRDGKRFYLLRPTSVPGASGIAVVANWAAGLK